MIGEKIKQRRKQLGLTQEQLALKVGVRKTSISNYEVNLNSPPEKVIIKIMEALECDANFLFGDYEKNQIILTKHENAVITAYRNKPDMQLAVDKILDVKDDISVIIPNEDEENKYTKFVAARSKDGQSPMRIEKGSKEQYEDLLNAPKSKMDL